MTKKSNKTNKAATATKRQSTVETRYIRVFQPDANFNMNMAGFICFNGKCIYVQDACETQNSQLFYEGIKLIDTMVTPIRRNYLFKMLEFLLPNEDLTQDEIMELSSKNLCQIIALVCDIACHHTKKLANPLAYDKDFKKYVANLFGVLGLDITFDIYKKSEERLLSIPEWFCDQNKYMKMFLAA